MQVWVLNSEGESSTTNSVTISDNHSVIATEKHESFRFVYSIAKMMKLQLLIVLALVALVLGNTCGVSLPSSLYVFKLKHDVRAIVPQTLAQLVHAALLHCV
jgi:hypothetical protein